MVDNRDNGYEKLKLKTMLTASFDVSTLWWVKIENFHVTC